jgi:RES domain-containing protein
MVSRYRGPLGVFRIADSRYPLFDGAGAERLGGRWNSVGHRVIYASLSFAGALIEKLAQTGTGSIPKRQQWIEIGIPATVEIEEISAADLPGWDEPDQLASRAYGDAWIVAQRTAVLVVPSVVGRPHERNAVINQRHGAFGRITATAPEPVQWNERLFQG